jgi:hypothetical protein
MDTKITIEMGPILLQLFEINAKVDALTDCLLNTDDETISRKLDQAYEKRLKQIMNKFKRIFPDFIEELPEELK